MSRVHAGSRHRTYAIRGATDSESDIIVYQAAAAPTDGVLPGGQVMPSGQKAECHVKGAIYYTADGGSTWALTVSGSGGAMVSEDILAPIAAAVDSVHASSDDDTQVWPGPFTDPDVPRNASITFGASWAGGDVTLTGTDYADAVLTEVIADSAGATVKGSKVFKTITGAENELVGAGGAGHGATIGTDIKLGTTSNLDASIGLLAVAGTTEVGVWDSGKNGVTPTTAPDGAKDFTLLYPSS